MRIRNRRRTLYSILAALGFAAMIFLYFQVFSVTMIDLQRQRSDSVKGKSDSNDRKSDLENLKLELEWPNKNKGHEKCLTSDCEERSNRTLKNTIKEDVLKASIKEDVLLKEPVFEMPLGDYPRGIKIELAAKYKPDSSNMFTCLHSKEVIPFSEVNDDYCDCADGSDEPGTAACPHTRFFCTFQGPGIKLHYIASGRVNDGLCDCCDGSDEWSGLALPQHVALGDQRAHYGLYQAPCENRCQRQEALAQENLAMRRQGAVLKQEYIQAAVGHSNPEQLYGPQGEFVRLSQQCYEAKWDKYEYTVCPFRDAKQQAFPAPATLIGQRPRWDNQDPHQGPLVLRMVNGDSRNCPGNEPRQTKLRFECGLTDAVISVHETEVCQYTVEFTTPAAC